ncbi:MAG: glycerophosphodiester phosphodiesterase family protein, partial [Halieaceae bacterium]
MSTPNALLRIKRLEASVMLVFLQDVAMAVADFIMASIPRPIPTPTALNDCRIISHRGEFDNSAVMENTLEAFHVARHHGVWGLECDIRWTADLVPVICHDADASRVFGNPTIIAEVSFSELRERVPLI